MNRTMSPAVLRVSAKAEGYRREGLKFSVEASDIPMAMLTSAQVNRLKSDTMLECVVVKAGQEMTVDADELMELRDKAAIGEAFIAVVPEDWEGHPVDYVANLQAQLTAQKAPDHASAKSAAKPHGK